MKKVLFFIESLQCGGAEKSLVTLLSLLDYNEFKIDLILFKMNVKETTQGSALQNFYEHE